MICPQAKPRNTVTKIVKLDNAGLFTGLKGYVGDPNAIIFGKVKRVTGRKKIAWGTYRLK